MTTRQIGGSHCPVCSLQRGIFLNFIIIRQSNKWIFISSDILIFLCECTLWLPKQGQNKDTSFIKPVSWYELFYQSRVGIWLSWNIESYIHICTNTLQVIINFCFESIIFLKIITHLTNCISTWTGVSGRKTRVEIGEYTPMLWIVRVLFELVGYVLRVNSLVFVLQNSRGFQGTE